MMHHISCYLCAAYRFQCLTLLLWWDNRHQHILKEIEKGSDDAISIQLLFKTKENWCFPFMRRKGSLLCSFVALHSLQTCLWLRVLLMSLPLLTTRSAAKSSIKWCQAAGKRRNAKHDHVKQKLSMDWGWKIRWLWLEMENGNFLSGRHCKQKWKPRDDSYLFSEGIFGELASWGVLLAQH